MKINNKTRNWFARSVLCNYASKELVDLPKPCFFMPVGRWIHNLFCEREDGLLNKYKLRGEWYFGTVLVKRMQDQYLREKYNWTPYLWTVPIFQFWLSISNDKNKLTGNCYK
jgi:hypothetical protein